MSKKNIVESQNNSNYLQKKATGKKNKKQTPKKSNQASGYGPTNLSKYS